MIDIRAMTAQDWPAVETIYREGIDAGTATFEIATPTWPAFDAAHLPGCRLVILHDGVLQGWAALSPYSARHVYRGVAIVSIYIAAAARGLGLGRKLLDALIVESENAGLWTLQAGIFESNAASLRLHANAGFRIVGVRERLGQLHGRWINVVLLERRSSAI
ncbi:GNAT family N-acetyltransferase [Amantichitinum ursilacus]|nr:GNAT family N-acetyltransferase [Amantichitinum ursilacus]